LRGKEGKQAFSEVESIIGASRASVRDVCSSSLATPGHNYPLKAETGIHLSGTESNRKIGVDVESAARTSISRLNVIEGPPRARSSLFEGKVRIFTLCKVSMTAVKKVAMVGTKG
jgi:hypothetical protein